MKATLIFSLFFFILRATGQINLDTFYIFDFYQKQPEGLGGMYPGKIGCDSIVVTINSKVVVLKAINATHSSNDFAVKATMEGLRIVKPKEDSVIINLKGKSCHKHTLANNRCFNLDTNIIVKNIDKEHAYFTPYYKWKSWRLGSDIPTHFFYTNKNEIFYLKLNKPRVRKRLIPKLIAACTYTYNTITGELSKK